MNARAWKTLGSLVLLTFATVAHGEPTDTAIDAPAKRFARLWIEAGPSFDRRPPENGGENGYAIAGGVEFGRTFALLLAAGFEHYPGETDTTTITGLIGPPSFLRAEGGGNKTALTGSVGLRIGLPIDHVEPFFETTIGLVSYAYRTPRYVDPTTNAEYYPARKVEDSALLGEIGVGIRSRHASGYDWTVGLRTRNYSQLYEGNSGSSWQIRFGIVTP